MILRRFNSAIVGFTRSANNKDSHLLVNNFGENQFLNNSDNTSDRVEMCKNNLNLKKKLYNKFLELNSDKTNSHSLFNLLRFVRNS